MRTRAIVGRSLLLAVFAFGLAACGGKTMVKSDLGIRGAPNWVNQGTNILKDKNGRLFHGVGTAPPMGDESLQIATADERARAEVARVLSSYMDVVSSDYLAANGTGKDTQAEQSVSRQIKNLTRVNLSGARIIGRWRDKHTGDIWSIAELDMNHVKSTLAGVHEMNADLKRYIQSHADNIFDREATTKEAQ